MTELIIFFATRQEASDYIKKVDSTMGWPDRKLGVDTWMRDDQIIEDKKRGLFGVYHSDPIKDIAYPITATVKSMQTAVAEDVFEEIYNYKPRPQGPLAKYRWHLAAGAAGAAAAAGYLAWTYLS